MFTLMKNARLQVLKRRQTFVTVNCKRKRVEELFQQIKCSQQIIIPLKLKLSSIWPQSNQIKKALMWFSDNDNNAPLDGERRGNIYHLLPRTICLLLQVLKAFLYEHAKMLFP